MPDTLLYFLLYLQFKGTIDENLVVNLPQGKIRGHSLITPNGNEFYAFQEVPYAAPQLGDSDSREAIPPNSWDGILDTTQNTKICPQQNRFDPKPDPRENEDCLYLNVYVPKVLDSNLGPLPVMFYIYGGGFSFGDATFESYGPQLFMDAGVIVVMFNYRTGPLGFLTTRDGVIPANIGLKDQLFALQWVRANIHLFGGSPSKITIVGNSSGAGAANYLVTSKRTTGLIRAAILQSGTVLCPGFIQEHARYFAFQMGKALCSDFPSRNSSLDLLNLLQSAPLSLMQSTTIDLEIRLNFETPGTCNNNSGMEKIKKLFRLKCKEDIGRNSLGCAFPAQSLIIFLDPEGMSNSISPMDGGIWKPIIENAWLENALIIGPMHENVKFGNINQVPTLTGITSFEGGDFTTIAVPEGDVSRYDDNLELLVCDTVNVLDEVKSLMGEELRSIYTRGRFQDSYKAFAEFYSSERFATPQIRNAHLMSHYEDVYFYQFSYKGPMGNRTRLNFKGKDKVVHAEELHYMFFDRWNQDLSKYPKSDFTTRNRLLKLWTNFIKYQNPTPEYDPLLQNIMWPTVKPNNFLYLDIDTNLTIRRDPKQYREWKRVFDKYAKGILDVY